MKRSLFFITLFILTTIPISEGIAGIKTTEVRFVIDQSPKIIISPYIYGLATYMAEPRKDSNVWDLNPAHFRFGGNTSSRFNWKINAWNAGNDWLFTNFKSKIPNMVDFFLEENVKHDVASSVTLPIMGWVAKDDHSSSYPVSIFGKQNGAHKDAGNGIDLKGKRIKADPNRCCIKVGPDFIAEWVNHLKSRFGPHPHAYILDNEPMLWWKTHPDVHFEPATYDEYWEKFLGAATAVRKADPKAVIIAPAIWGWLAMEYSSMDMPSEWNGWVKGTDRKKHGDTPFLEWFLTKVRDEEKKLGISLLDVLDVHYYPDGEIKNSKPDTDKNRQIRIEATRSLWDKTYTDRSWIKEAIYLIPRLKELVAKTKPDLKVALGEYNFRAEQDIAGAIAQAELLGIFASYNLDMANYWTIPPEGSPVSFAFKMFRNYDGKKSTFGSELIKNSVGIKDKVSIFSARHSKEKIFTIVAINKDLSEQQELDLVLPEGLGSIKSTRIFIYDRDTPKAIQSKSLGKQKRVSITMKPLSLFMVEVGY